MIIKNEVRVQYHCPYCDTNISWQRYKQCPACLRDVKYPEDAVFETSTEGYTTGEAVAEFVGRHPITFKILNSPRNMANYMILFGDWIIDKYKKHIRT